MKKTALLLSLCVGALAANAQIAHYSLSGTSYTQNFDGIGTGLPVGWYGYINATATDTGNVYVDMISGSPVPFGSTAYGRYNNASGTDTLPGACGSDVFGAGFKNVPSADAGAGTTMMTCGQEQAVVNRAFGIRQKSGAGYDPGAAFCFVIAKTTGLTNFNLTFNLQTLDTTSARTTIWEVDYGIGGGPTAFTVVTTSPSSLTTGGYSFGSKPVTVSFGSALNNSTVPVWIRVAAISASTGTGTRTTSAIDDFHLTWTGNASGINNISAQPATALLVIGQPTSDKITLAYGVEEEGAYMLHIYDLTGRVVYTENINTLQGDHTITVNGLNLIPGMYIAKLSNGNSSSAARIAVQ